MTVASFEHLIEDVGSTLVELQQAQEDQTQHGSLSPTRVITPILSNTNGPPTIGKESMLSNICQGRTCPPPHT